MSWKAKIGIVDYTGGNQRSIVQAFEYLDCDVRICRNKRDIDDVSYLVLPGVGAFGEVMAQLEQADLITPITDWCAKGAPFLGICVGMQVMLTRGFEFGQHRGLGVVSGDAVSLQSQIKDMRVPHTGWAHVHFKEDSLFADASYEERFFYFNHSYICQLEDQYVSGVADGDASFTAVIEQGNVIGIQAHPEKSHTAGLNFLRGFVEAGKG